MSEDLSTRKSPVPAILLGTTGGVGSYLATQKVDKVKEWVTDSAKTWDDLVKEAKDTTSFSTKVEALEGEEATAAKDMSKEIADRNKLYEDFIADENNKYKFEQTAEDAEKVKTAQTNLANAEQNVVEKRQQYINEETAKLRANNTTTTRVIKPTIKDFGDPDKITQEMLDEATAKKRKAAEDAISKRKQNFENKLQEFADRRYAIMEEGKGASGQAKRVADQKCAEIDKEIKAYLENEVKTWGKTPLKHSTYVNNATVAINQYGIDLQDRVVSNKRIKTQKQLVKQYNEALKKLKDSGYTEAAKVIEEEGMINLADGSKLSKAMRQGQADFRNISTLYEKFEAINPNEQKPFMRVVQNGNTVYEIILDGKNNSADKVQEFLKTLSKEERTRLAQILKNNGIEEVTAENLKQVVGKVSVADGIAAKDQLKDIYGRIGNLIEEELPGRGNGFKVQGSRVIKKNGYEFIAKPVLKGEKPVLNYVNGFPVEADVKPVTKGEYINDWIKANIRTETVGKKLSEEEITAKAKEAAEGKLGNEKSIVEEMKAKLTEATKAGSKKERTEDELVKLFEEKHGTESEFFNKLKGQYESKFKKLFEGEKNNWKVAGIVAAGTAIAALIGSLVTPRKEV